MNTSTNEETKEIALMIREMAEDGKRSRDYAKFLQGIEKRLLGMPEGEPKASLGKIRNKCQKIIEDLAQLIADQEHYLTARCGVTQAQIDQALER